MKSVKARDIRTAITNNGWYFVNQEGSHRHYKHSEIPVKITVAGEKEIRGKALYDLEKITGLKF